MRLIFLFLLLTTGILFSCKNDTKQPTPLVVTMTEAASKKCVHDTICAEIKLSYPVLTGGLNPVATQAINDSLLSLATGVRFCVFKFVHDAARSIGHVAGLSGRFYQ